MQSLSDDKRASVLSNKASPNHHAANDSVTKSPFADKAASMIKNRRKNSGSDPKDN